VVHAADAISAWISKNIENPVLIGPDSESEQWVADVAEKAGVPFIVLQKIRHGDRNVEISVPDVDKYKNATPILVDDIISTAHTMIETVKHLKKAGMKPPICIGIHAVFSGDAYQDLKDSGVEKIVTCNTIPHLSNAIDLSGMIAESVQKLMLHR
jgi:ribose-phosphate pyrophosphokinase